WDFTARLAAQRGAAGRNDWPERDGNLCRIELPKANGPQEPDRSRAPSSLLWVPTQPARLKLARRGQSWGTGPRIGLERSTSSSGNLTAPVGTAGAQILRGQ